MPEPISRSGGITTFFSNPLVGMLGTIASVIGVFLAVYFYWEAKENPQLTYYVNPVKAVVVRSGQASRLTASFDNKVIETDITAAQIAIWNQGKQTIKKDHILKPIVIYTENQVPILEATIRKMTRDVTQLSLNTEELQKGRVTIQWNILEHNDGGVIQLIYSGDSNLAIRLDGVVEGQKQIEESRFFGRIRSPDEQYSSARRGPRIIGFVSLFLGLGLLALYFFYTVAMRRFHSQHERLDTEIDELKTLDTSGFTEAEVKDFEMKFEGAKSRHEEFLAKSWINQVMKHVNRGMPLIVALYCLVLIGFGIVSLYRGQESGPPFGF